MYACCILLISTASVIVSLIETMRNNEDVRAMAVYSCQVERMSGTAGQTEINDSKELVPGDLIVVPEG